MALYVVTKNEEPCHATFDESEAVALFNTSVRSRANERVAVLKLPATWNVQVVLESATLIEPN